MLTKLLGTAWRTVIGGLVFAAALVSSRLALRAAGALVFLLCGATTTPAQLSSLSDSQEPNGIRLTYLGHAG